MRQPLNLNTACIISLESLKTRKLLPARSALMSSGGLDLIGGLGIEVLPDGIVVYGCPHSHKQVPNGMGERDDAVAFEEDHPKTVAGPAHQELAQPRLLWLRRKQRVYYFSFLKNMTMGSCHKTTHTTQMRLKEWAHH